MHAPSGTIADAQNGNRTRRPPDSRTSPAPSPTPPVKTSDEPIGQSDDVVRVETDLTNVLFTATDKQRRFFTGLQREDVRVLEDGKPQEVFSFAKQTDLPLSLAILVDTSGSQQRTLPEEKEAAREFVDAVMRPNKDEAAVISFTGDATLEQGLTGNSVNIRRALDGIRISLPGGGYGGVPPLNGDSREGSTAIWDAVWVAADEVLSQTSDRTRRAIILLTDGVDTSSRYKRDQAIDRAVRADVVVYSIGIGDEYAYGLDQGALRKISERTGGRAFFPRSEEDLRAAFAQIQDELRSQYLLAYSPTNKARDGSFRKVEIEITNPELRKQNLKLTYRQGYFAKTTASNRAIRN
jgi:VWFA-related protein